MSITDSAKAENVAKMYLRTNHGAFSFKEINVLRRYVDGWIVEGFLFTLWAGWSYFVVYVDNEKVSSCSIY
jgi:hypothetical protein